MRSETVPFAAPTHSAARRHDDCSGLGDKQLHHDDDRPQDDDHRW